MGGCCYSLQLFGRAGRDGSLSRAHLFTNHREVSRCKDADLSAFCNSKENCRRQLLLRALGSSEAVHALNTRCCDICSLYDSEDINIFRCLPVQRRRASRTLRGSMCDSLKQALEQERERIVASDPGYQMLGHNLVLSNKCIMELSKHARDIHSEDDLHSFPGVRMSLVSRLYRVISDFFCQ